VFCIGVGKVDRDVALVAMAIHVCFKCMFQMFHLFQMYVASVSSRCCKSRSGCCIYMHVAGVCFKCFRCFICMLQVFYPDVVYAAMATTCFLGVSNVCCKCFNGFGRTLQAAAELVNFNA
jgi:hypothetical protein